MENLDKGLLSLGFIIPLVLLLILFGLAFYFKKENRKLSYYLNHYPYETFEMEEKGKSTILRLMASLYALSYFIFPLILLLASEEAGTNVTVYLVFALVMSILGEGLLSLSYFIPLPQTKFHFYTLVFGQVISSVPNICYGLLLLTWGRNAVINQAVGMGLGLFLIILSLLPILIFFLPGIREWNHMEVQSEKDGTTSLKRPDKITLAIYENILPFINLFLLLLSYVCFLFI